MKKRIVLFDPVPFKGGSKIMMSTVLSLCKAKADIVILSKDMNYWEKSGYKVHELYCPNFILKQTSGIYYFLKQLILVVNLVCRFRQIANVDRAIGLSGPTVDFSIYIAKLLFDIKIIQMVQGEVPFSRVAGYGLKNADEVFYLPSTKNSIQNAISKFNKSDHIEHGKFKSFINGIDSKAIKSSISNKKTNVLWAASLIEWKNLPLFEKAILNIKQNKIAQKCFNATVCYINPYSHSFTPSEQAKLALDYIEDPSDLSLIRAKSSVFVSTALYEPFGLSILEAMVAGLAVVIPQDGAYWDKTLIHKESCIKYKPNCYRSLSEAISLLLNDSELRQKISHNGKFITGNYTHEKCYQSLINCIIA